MAGIEISSAEEPWMVSRWIFRRLLEDVAATSPADAELQEAVNVGVANEMLFLDRVTPAVRERVKHALVQVSKDVVDGGPDRLGDIPADMQPVFIRATSNLLRMLTATNGNGGG